MNDRIRIKLKSYDHRLLDKWVDELVTKVKRTGARVVGPVPLPTKETLFTVLRSPHVNKKSREQFVMRIHKRLIEIMDANNQTVKTLETLEAPAGIDIKMEL